MATLLLLLLSKPRGINAHRELKQNYNVVHVELKQKADDELKLILELRKKISQLYFWLCLKKKKKKRLQAVMQAPTFPNKRAHAAPTLYILILPEC